jgi:Ice-binding-like
LLKLSTLTKWAVFAGLAVCGALVAGASSAGAATAPSLGSAGSFAVLAGSMVTNTGPTTISGDIGVSPGSAITGAGSITDTGATHAGDAVALQAQNDVTTAYNALAAAPCTQSLGGTAVEVGGHTLTPGVYCYSSSAQLTGTLTLDAQGDANAVFIFKTVSTLTTASNSSVVMINGGQPCNAYWKIGSSATLGTSTAFVGNILALTSISLTSGAKVSGRALARNGAVTMDTNTVSATACGAAGATPTAIATLPPATQTAVTAATNTAVAAATAMAIATLPPATQTAVTAATNTAVAAATAMAIATPTAAPSQRTPAATSAVLGVISGPNTGSGPVAASAHDSWITALVLLVAGCGALLLGGRRMRKRSG